MAEGFPPDSNRRAGHKGGDKSGKVADFRYKRPAQPERRYGPAPCEAAGDGQAPRAPRNGGGQPNERYHQAYAALDLGTNNCRLLIARPAGEHFTVIDAFSRVVRLGEGLAMSGRLSDQAMDRALGALHICADKLRRRNVRLARSVATEACRRKTARNSSTVSGAKPDWCWTSSAPRKRRGWRCSVATSCWSRATARR